jgi:hypothetical protein
MITLDSAPLCLTACARWRSYFALWIVSAALAIGLTGCQSPYHSDQGALFGGVTGAGVGALVGNAVGSPAAGAAIGAGVGAVTGAVVGSSLDEIEAKNRAEIEARLGRPVAAGAVSIDDVITMTRAGVAEDLIITHVRSHGMVAPLQTNDLIVLQQQGVSTRVIQVMQAPPPQVVQAVPGPTPVIIEERYMAPPPYWGPSPYWGYHYHHHPRHRHRHHHHSGVTWGVSVGH